MGLVLLLFSSLFAQGPSIIWERTYGGQDDDYAYAMKPTLDGGYILCGKTKSFGAEFGDIYLVKTDSQGNMLWSKTFGRDTTDVGWDVQQTSDRGYIIIGFTYHFGSWYPDIFMVRTNHEGEMLWNKIFDWGFINSGYSIQQTFDGCYIIAGCKADDAYVIKTDSMGDTIWTRTYGGTNDEVFYSIQQTSDSGYIAAGYTSSFGEGWDDVYLVKTDSYGNEIWAKTFGSDEWESARSVQQTPDGGYILCGSSSSFGSSVRSVYLIKTNADGESLWTRTYGGAYVDKGQFIQQTFDGGYIITGETQSFGSGEADILVLKIDSLGNLSWMKAYGGIYWDEGYSIYQTQDEGFIIAGSTTSEDFNTDAFLLKTGPDFVDEEDELPATSPLFCSSFPNPFSNTTLVKYGLHEGDNILIEIYNLQGQRVKKLLGNKIETPGIHRITWDGKGSSGKELSNGIYFIHFRAGEHSTSEKLIKIK